MQISRAVAISSAIPRIRACGDHPGEGGWTLLCQREGVVGAGPNPASLARLSQPSSRLFPTAMPLFHPCDFLPSCPLCAGSLHAPVFGCHSFLHSSWGALPVSHISCSPFLPCAVAAEVKPREQGQHLDCASTWRQQLPQQPQLDVGWGRCMGRERGRKKGPVHEIFQVGKIGRTANAPEEEAALSQALGQVRRQ